MTHYAGLREIGGLFRFALAAPYDACVNEPSQQPGRRPSVWWPLLGEARHTSDARGHRMQVLDPLRDSRCADAATRRRVHESATRWGVPPAFLYAFLIVIVASPFMGGFGAVVVACALVVAVVVAAASMPPARSSDLVREWLAFGCCASCGYSLKGIHADADGCTVCPECGAAWKLPDPVH